MEFPILKKKTTLGSIPDVETPVLVKTGYGYQRMDFLLDTGADFTMPPAHLAEWLRINLNNLPKDRSYGIEGGKGVAVRVAKIRVKVCQYELDIRRLFSDNDACPYILGRVDIFPHFNILFDNDAGKIKLAKIKYNQLCNLTYVVVFILNEVKNLI